MEAPRKVRCGGWASVAIWAAGGLAHNRCLLAKSPRTKRDKSTVRSFSQSNLTVGSKAASAVYGAQVVEKDEGADSYG